MPESVTRKFWARNEESGEWEKREQKLTAMKRAVPRGGANPPLPGDDATPSPADDPTSPFDFTPSEAAAVAESDDPADTWPEALDPVDTDLPAVG